MALTITVTRGFTMVAEAFMSVDDWNAAFLPTITISGGVGGSDIADDSVSFNHLGAQAFNGATAVTTLALDDVVPVYDLSATDNRKVTVANLINGVFSLSATAATTFVSYTGDKLTLHNGTAPVTMTPAILAEQLVAQATELATTDDADEVLVRDASAADGSQAARVTLANLLPAKGTAGTYTGVTGLTTDAKGRVTAVVTQTGTNLVVKSLTAAAIPASGAATFAHGLAAMPSYVRAVLRCTNAGGDLGYSQNDELAIESTFMDNGTNDFPSFAVSANATNVYVVRFSNPAGSVFTLNRGTGVNAAIDTTKWEILVRVAA
jgi:hypothetical protein